MPIKKLFLLGLSVGLLLHIASGLNAKPTFTPISSKSNSSFQITFDSKKGANGVSEIMGTVWPKDNFSTLELKWSGLKGFTHIEGALQSTFTNVKRNQPVQVKIVVKSESDVNASLYLEAATYIEKERVGVVELFIPSNQLDESNRKSLMIKRLDKKKSITVFE